MSKVILELSMSLDGYVAGPNVDKDNPMGDGGEHVHDWMFTGKSPAESRAWEEGKFSTVGALVMGRRVADLGIGPWGENPTFHAPCFVVTHREHEPIIKEGGTTYTFVTRGIDAALEEAKAAAGAEDVVVMGGAVIAQQFLNAGLLDEFRLHLVPIVLGGGTRLFDRVDRILALSVVDVAHEPLVTHLTYRIGGGQPRASS